ncbi:MAG: DUF2079 domain-containing protein [Oscillospiraceae bacterium]|nr:DUF2079 domain-containing protein [Oscillospiraceae bacterium]
MAKKKKQRPPVTAKPAAPEAKNQPEAPVSAASPETTEQQSLPEPVQTEQRKQDAAPAAESEQQTAKEEPASDAEKKQDVYNFQALKRDVTEWFAKYELPDMLLSRCIVAYFLTAAFWVVFYRRKFGTKPVDDWRTYITRFTEDGRTTISVILILSIIVGLSCICYLLPKRRRIVDQLLAIGSVLTFDIAVLWRANNFYLTAAVMFVSLVFIFYELGKLKSLDILEHVPWKVCGIISLIAVIGVTAFISWLTICRHYTFGTASHDFGLFIHMFYNLANRFSAVSTVEREYPISHFRIHASYIYYLLVPIYKMIPHPNTLLISQAVLAMGGAIPTFLIAKRRKFKGIPLIFVTFAYVFSVCFSAPCFYDFHENAFLPTLLMWLLWAVDSERHIWTAVFSVLVCITKEDAPLYILCIGLFIFFDRKGKKLLERAEGLIMAAVSGGYMLFITNWLTKNGDGQLMTTTRFGPMMIDQSAGLTEVIKNVLLDPIFFFSLLIKEETLRFFLTVMLPLLFLPFLTKKIHRFWLMVPFIVMNLAIGAGYGYAADVNYHYVFGTGALLLYMAIINLDDFEDRNRQSMAILTGSATIMSFFGLLSHQLTNSDCYNGGKEIFDKEVEILETLPKDRVVCATAFLIPHCCNRDYIYLIDKLDFDESTDKLIDPNKYDLIAVPPGNEIGQKTVTQLEELGWTIYDQVEGRIVVYENPNSPVPKPDVYSKTAEN